MINVLYLITELRTGGAERALYDLATHLDRERFAPVAACLTGRGEVGAQLEDAGVPVHYLDMKGKWDFRVLFRLRRLLREQEIDILHTFLFHANMVGRLAGRPAHTPVCVSSIHLPETRRVRLAAESLTSGLVDRVICVSETVLEHTRARGRMPRDKLVLIPNGIDVARFDPGGRRDSLRRAVRGEMDIPPDAPLFITVTRLHPEKGVEHLLSAARTILDMEPSAHILVAGEGRMMPVAESAVSAWGKPASRVHLLGMRHDVPRLLGASDVFIFASPREGLGIAVLEAMAAGAPVVAFDVPGVREALGGHGVLVEYGDCEALAGQAVRLARDAAAAGIVAENARKHVERKFSLNAMVNRTQDLYRRVCV